MKLVRFHPSAFAELEAAASNYAGQRSGLGTLFLAEARNSQERIAELPAAARRIRGSIRRRRIHKFPYFLSYSVEADEIVVIAVAHRRRQPEYWANRLKDT